MEDGGSIIFEGEDLTSPMRGSKDGYLQTFFALERMFGQIIANTDPSSVRISIFIDFLIGTITDENMQKNAYLEKDKRIETAIEEYKKEHDISIVDDSTRCLIENRISARFIGEITAWYDGELAISHYKEIGTVH